MIQKILCIAILLLAIPGRAVLVDDNDTDGVCNGNYTLNPPFGPIPQWFTNSAINIRVNPNPGASSATYIRNGYVLGAAHIGPGLGIDLHGTRYETIPSFFVEFDIDGLYWKLKEPYPAIPDLQIATVNPSIGTLTHSVGAGVPRGSANGSIGWFFEGAAGTLRWGTNHISAFTSQTVDISFDDINLSPPGLIDGFGNYECEAVAVVGDSGGGLFVDEGGTIKILGTTWTGAASSPVNFPKITTYQLLVPHLATLNAAFDTPNCNNGLDDDGDGFIDLADPDCVDANDTSELSPRSVGVTISGVTQQ